MKKLLKKWFSNKEDNASDTLVCSDLKPSAKANDRVAQQVEDHKVGRYWDYLRHLKAREGEVLEVYRDTQGYLTAGVGHLLPKDTSFKEGDPITQLQSDYWLYSDAQLAWDAALEQCGLLGVPEDNDFVVALACVNFQLGVNWYTIHKKTWAYMLEGDWVGAAEECYDSRWFKQTPVRVEDFRSALWKLSNEEP